MATPRTWLARAEEILAVLEMMKSTEIDRPAIEELFQLQRRAAITLMQQAGATGSPLLIERRVLAAWVNKIHDAESAIVARRQTTGEELSRSMQEVQAVRAALKDKGRPTLSFPLVDEVLRTTFTSLPSSIRVEPGRITVDFPADDPVAALQQLYTLAMAVANDLPTFEQIACMGVSPSSHELVLMEI